MAEEKAGTEMPSGASNDGDSDTPTAKASNGNEIGQLLSDQSCDLPRIHTNVCVFVVADGGLQRG